MNDRITVYVGIGNSDDKLTQEEWSEFVSLVQAMIRNLAAHQHGEYFSVPSAKWQNACWCLEFREEMIGFAQARLAQLARRFRQDWIAWAPAQTIMIYPEETDEKAQG